MQITYFPYLTLKENAVIDFGNNLKIWHFISLKDQFIPDATILDHVEKLLNMNVHGDTNEKLKGLGVISIGSTDFRAFNPIEEMQVEEAKLMLFLCKIAKTNTVILGSGSDGWTLSTSENFNPVFQNFEIGNNYISERTGYIIDLGVIGYKIHEKKFYKPGHIALSPFGLPLDTKLLDVLILLREKKGKRLFRKILRATDLIYQAYYNNINVSRNARILLIAAAFETLLDLKENQAKKEFKEYIEKYCDLPNEKKYRFYYYSHGTANRDKNRSIKVIWAEDFFNLRNQIIHGDYVIENAYLFQNENRHIDIAILFFCLLVKKLIVDKLKKRYFLDFIEWKQREDGTMGFHYEDMSISIALSQILNQSRR